MDNDVYSLKSDILSLLESSSFSDVELLVDQGKSVFRAHRCILVARCPYFRSILGDGDTRNELDFTRQSTQLPIKIMIDTSDTACFAAVLRYIYSDKAELGGANVWNVLQLATLYQIFGLIRACEKIISTSLVPASVLECWTASLKLNPSIDGNYIASQCELFAARNLSQVIYMDSFLVLPSFLFLRLIRTADPQLPGMDQTIIQALLRYLKGPEGDKPGVRADLSQHVPNILKGMIISYTSPEIIQEMSLYLDVFSPEFIGRASNCVPSHASQSRLYNRRSSDSAVKMIQVRDASHPNMREVVFSQASPETLVNPGKQWEKYAGKMRFKVNRTGGNAKKAAKHSENATPSSSASNSRRSSVDVSSFMSFASLTPDLAGLARRNSLDPSLLGRGIDPAQLALALRRNSVTGESAYDSPTETRSNENSDSEEGDQDDRNERVQPSVSFSLPSATTSSVPFGNFQFPPPPPSASSQTSTSSPPQPVLTQQQLMSLMAAQLSGGGGSSSNAPFMFGGVQDHMVGTPKNPSSQDQMVSSPSGTSSKRSSQQYMFTTSLQDYGGGSPGDM